MTAIRKPLFPFSIPIHDAFRIAEKDAEYAKKVASERRYTNIERLEVSGTVSAAKILHLVGWMSTDNGFVMTGGRFWEKKIDLTEERFSALITQELERRAWEEIDREDVEKMKIRVQARADLIRFELNIDGETK